MSKTKSPSQRRVGSQDEVRKGLDQIKHPNEKLNPNEKKYSKNHQLLAEELDVDRNELRDRDHIKTKRS